MPAGRRLVAASLGSAAERALSKRAASRTVRAIGPGVSWECEMGTTPVRLTRPTVGFTPTMPQVDDGHMIEPSVSVPTASAARLAAMPAPEPEREPQGLGASA